MKSIFIFLFFWVQIASAKALEDKILTLEKEVAEIYTSISTNNSTIMSTQQQIADINAGIDIKKKYIAQRLLAQKNIKSMSWYLMFDSKNKTVFDRNLRIFKNINNSDLAAMSEYRLQISELNDQVALLEKENKKLLVLANQLRVKEKALKKAEQDHLIELAQEKNADHQLNLKGQLSLPLQSRIIEKFGGSQDKENQYVLMVKGLVMSGADRKPVSAFGPGKVIFSDRIPYWGESLIISHKGGYYSVYSGVENVRVKNDEVVVNEQVIADTNGKDFYFEFRHQDIPLNPLTWVRKDHEQTSR